MPVYQYHCPANDQDVLVKHCRKNEVATWRQLCLRAHQPMGETDGESPVELVEQHECACGEQYNPDECCGCKNNKLCSSLMCDMTCEKKSA
jgi:hypothetical protein